MCGRLAARRSMRVIHVITRLIVGGAQENTVASVLGLRQQHGLDVSLVAGPTIGPEGSLLEMYRSSGAPFTLAPDLIRPIRPLADRRALAFLTDHLRSERPDIVHTHSGKAGFLGRLAAETSGVPVIIHSIHGPSFGRFQGIMANIALLAAERRAGRVTTHFVAVADAMSEQYLAAGIGKPEQYSVIRSGFDVDDFDQVQPDPVLQRQLHLQKGDFVIGKIARLFELKGHDELLSTAPDILQKCPQAKFLLVGDGDWRKRLEEKAKRLGIRDRVAFAGLVQPEEIPRYIGLMSMLVHLSHREGLPRALAQALAAGKPVVAWDCDGAGEICRNDETGILLKPDDLNGLVKAVTRLAKDEPLRNKLGSTGRAWVRKHFTVEGMVSAQHELYQRLLAGH